MIEEENSVLAVVFKDKLFLKIRSFALFDCRETSFCLHIRYKVYTNITQYIVIEINRISLTTDPTKNVQT